MKTFPYLKTLSNKAMLSRRIYQRQYSSEKEKHESSLDTFCRKIFSHTKDCK